MSIEKFNELYIGVAMIFNGQAPANSTLLTDDEMRNIKGSWHTEIKIRAKWIPGWIQWVKYRVTVSFKIPYIKLNWVSVYRWGPVNIGYWWPQLCWKRIVISKVIKIPIYHPGRLVFYAERYRVPDIWDIKPSKRLEIGAKLGGATVAGLTCAASVATIIGTDGFAVPFAGPMAVASGTSFACTAGLIYCDLTDPETYNKDPDPGNTGPICYPQDILTSRCFLYRTRT